ncbi:MAG TPA: hypothetical protein VIN11_04470 [Roseivirga sp.]
MKKRGVFNWMRNLIAILLIFVLTAHGCKDTLSDTNPQLDNQDFSPIFSVGVEETEVKIADLVEASGLINSRSNSSYFWSHNDSGGSPTLYLFSREGTEALRLDFNDAQNTDWEELAIGPGPVDNINYLYVGDFGDNRAVRDNYTIYRTPEPDLNATGLPSNISLRPNEYDRISFEYADGPRDAEAFFVDPSSKDIYLISKREPSVILYKIAFPQSTTEKNVAERIMTLPFTFITAADISPSGNEILIKNYLNIYLWQKEGTETIEQTLTKNPNRLKYTVEPQGEAIAWDTDESSYYTLSESDGSNPVILYRYNRN